MEMVKLQANANHYEEITIIGFGKTKNRKIFNGLLCKRFSKRIKLQFTLARNPIQNSKFYLIHKITIHMKL